MATMQDRETFGRARLSFAKEADIDEFVSLLARFESGDIGPDEWRAFRLLRGTYGQRQTGDAQMLRIKIPQGILLRNQLDAIASVAERYSRGFGHITTRQNVQLHFVKLHDAEPAMRELAAAGHDHARGVRKLGAQHHRVPVLGRREGRSVRRHTVRGSADALSAAPSVELGACRASSRSRSRGAPKITSDRRSTTSAGTRGFRRSAAARFAASGSPSRAAPRR